MIGEDGEVGVDAQDVGGGMTLYGQGQMEGRLSRDDGNKGAKSREKVKGSHFGGFAGVIEGVRKGGRVRQSSIWAGCGLWILGYI